MSEMLGINLLGMTLTQLQELCAAEGFPRFTAKQLCDWLYKHRVDSIDRMTNLSLAQRARLQEIAYVGRETPVNCQLSKDGTKKYLFPVLDGQHVEAVYIPDDDRATLCVSCQAGCRMNCRFCSTGAGGFHGNLSAGDIVNQFFSIPEFESLTNVVFMGMGEPMDNLDAVLDACQMLTAPWGLAWSPKRITVSTMGLIPGMRRFIEECQCHLAVSLHNPVPAERERLMPVQRAYPLGEVLALLRHYDWSGQRRLSFEYTMFRGLNDDLAHAARLVEALRGLDCRVNLIRFHENGARTADGHPLGTSTPSVIAAFESYLNSHGVTCTLRASRGQDIDAACGLLAGKNTR
ncbi:MAG: 23S rRNA (adenine(2503)-C(2))-methyltransferase RlmN [Bacteroidales bacterium]|nr:23S rRNA (adenine(2503)-C(2))-methyltransferase RlmN [Bacteroidales bacterium]